MSEIMFCVRVSPEIWSSLLVYYLFDLSLLLVSHREELS